jgi:hypothetical protein
MNNAILRFAKQLTQYDPLLQARVEGLYHKIFEGAGTLAALDNLKDQVGDNSFETEGEGVFGLSNEAGFDGDKVPNDNMEQAIDDGVEAGNFDDFGTAISAESAPTEDDFGLGDEAPADDGFDMFGGEDSGLSSDLGLDGMDDEIPDGTEDAGDDTADLPKSPSGGKDDVFPEPEGDMEGDDSTLGI